MRTTFLILLLISSQVYAESLEDLRSYKAKTSPALASLKVTAIQEEAIQVGTAHGYYNHLNELIKTLEGQSDELDKLYDFRTVMRLASRKAPVSNVLPPVIVEADNEVLLDDKSETLQTSTKIYKILRGARLVSKAPIWQTYLLDRATEPGEPEPSLLPKTSDEQAVWEVNVENGWKAGEALAEREIKTRVRLLSRDYNGMLKYLNLVESGKAEPAYVAYSRTAVKGNGGQVKLDNHLYRITKKAQLKTKDW